MMRLLASALMTLVISQQALACRCREPSIPTAFVRADAVAVGVISEVRDLRPGDTRLAVSIEKSWKGSLANSIQVETGTTCKLAAQTGERYLLFLRRNRDGSYYTRKCMGDRSDPDPTLLRQLDKLRQTRTR
jgi:hypothetical protein